MKNMKETTNTKNRAAVPYIAFESAQARAERTTKRLFAALLESLTLNAGLLVWLLHSPCRSCRPDRNRRS